MTVASVLAVPALLVVAVGISVLISVRSPRAEITEQHRAIAALRARMAERGRAAVVRHRWESAQRAAEEVVDVGNESVRNVHTAIADIPFGVLEQIPVTRDASRAVREIHDVTANGIYDAIGFVNRLTGDRLRHGIRQPEAGDAEHRDDAGGAVD